MPTGSTARTNSKVKRRRVTQACDYCHERSIKCASAGGSDVKSCQNCHDFGHACTYNRTPRRRGVPPRAVNLETSRTDATTSPTTSFSRTQPTSPVAPKATSQMPVCSPVQNQNLENAWVAPFIASQGVIVDLVELYFEIIYPIFPFFHQQSFTRRISRADYVNDKSLFAVTMAVCSLVSSRVRDGAVSNPHWDLSTIQAISPRIFDAAAKNQLADQTPNTGLNTMRAHALLAVASIQNGKIEDLHFHLGTYHTLVAMGALHDESNWPKYIGNIEREERRRLFWSMYTLDIYVAVVWGGIIRCREKQSNVSYPLEMCDDMISDRSMSQPMLEQPIFVPTACDHSSHISPDCWLSGWNFITDIYRILEHALTRLREFRRNSLYPMSRDIFDDQMSTTTEASVGERVLQKYHNLPVCYKETPVMTFEPEKDRYAFQAANITGSLQLLRMVLLAAGGASIDARCVVAREVMDAFMSVPLSYLLAISTPLLHHLGGIGAILGSVIVEKSVGEAEYRTVQSILLSMAQLLENLEMIPRSSGASQNLRDRVARIEQHIELQRSLSVSQTELMHQVQSQTDAFVIDTNTAKGLPYTQVTPVMDQNQAVLQMEMPDLLGPLAWPLDFGQHGN
ncbi:hypothetical protein QQS21_005095 [Conoideocrella luteorostrata]|uniref:Zn(2)-C6 fungal-type domain-containing protein n=1 Tax=Conoideocrella luteorostrata TaxID=1105319 RepID=A0AAJ0FZD2_9HYPO|nr:hypothetical protein QQS21_005095 [Conoideocrella luteorostrata]